MNPEAIGLIALSFTLMLHLAGTIWWAASLTKRVEHIERWISGNEHTGERLVSLEANIQNMSHALARIEKHLLDS
jgi:hypothetical protein